MMKEEEVEKLFSLPTSELARELFELMPIEGKIPKKTFTKYWNKMGKEKMIALYKALTVLNQAKALEYARKYPWMGNPYL